MEGVLEIALLTLIYFLLWKGLYSGKWFPHYYGRGKWILMGVYAAITTATFYLSDSFKYGHLKLADVLMSQILSIFIVDLITYFQLCLIANHMISVYPMLLLFALDCLLCFVCVWMFTKIYHVMYVSHDMLLIYGNENALDLKFKMDTRQDRYTVTEIISVESNMQDIVNAIKCHDAVVINDVAGIKRNDILKYCYENSVRTYVVPKISDIILEGGEDINLFDTPLKLIKGVGLSLP